MKNLKVENLIFDPIQLPPGNGSKDAKIMKNRFKLKVKPNRVAIHNLQ